MKISLNQIVSNVDNIKSLQEVKLPVKVSYRITRLVNKLDPILKDYNKKRDDLIGQLGEEIVNDKGEKVKSITDPEKLKEFASELGKLLEVEEEVDFEPVSIESLGNVDIEPSKLVDFIFVE